MDKTNYYNGIRQTYGHEAVVYTKKWISTSYYLKKIFNQRRFLMAAEKQNLLLNNIVYSTLMNLKFSSFKTYKKLDKHLLHLRIKILELEIIDKNVEIKNIILKLRNIENTLANKTS